MLTGIDGDITEDAQCVCPIDRQHEHVPARNSGGDVGFVDSAIPDMLQRKKKSRRKNYWQERFDCKTKIYYLCKAIKRKQ